MTAAPPDEHRAALMGALSAAAVNAPGRLGVVVQAMNPHVMAWVGESELFPMHSTVKIFPAAWAFREIEAGRLNATQPVTLKLSESPLGSGRIDKEVEARGEYTTTLSAMIEAMLLDSDNAATDGIYKLPGGPEAIAQALLLPEGIAMSRTIRNQFRPMPKTRAEYDAWLSDPRDKASPMAFVVALERLAKGALAGPVADKRVLDLMEQSPLGKDRIPAGLGDAWRFIGRTGGGPTIEGRQTGHNHVGIAVHKETGRRIAIASFLRDSAGPADIKAAAHAAVGRAVAQAWPNG
jgi:beta-lactamase class A